ncbi:DUF1516 family protein [Guptibacillus hwajinpoensis]|uniref:DUF1516 family protein n=1 Tax=Guptibacillus hwajinpoensis TaxID=208199 RepID=UPI00351207D4
MLHAHYSAWGLTLILFLVSYFLMRAGKGKSLEMTHTILRIFYILTVISGMFLVIGYEFWGALYCERGRRPLAYFFDGNDTSKRKKREKKIWPFWLQFMFAFLLVIFYGYSVLHLYQL